MALASVSWTIFVHKMKESVEMAAFDTVDTELDLRGFRCPVPVLKLKKALKEFPKGIIKIVTTDPDSVGDFKEFARIKNLKMEYASIDGEYFFWLTIEKTNE